jgi:hypothetical protein
MASKARLQVECPKCGADPLVVGFSTTTAVSDMWMRIGGEVRRVARTSNVAPEAFCNLCHTKLPATAKELKAA